MEAPATTSSPTVTNTTTARPHIRCRACPKPGRSQPATATPQALFSEEVWFSALPGVVSTRVVSFISGLISFALVPSSREQRQNFRLHRPGYACFPVRNVHVHLRAHSEFRQINPRFYGIARRGDQVPFIPRFKAIHIRAVTVNRRA